MNNTLIKQTFPIIVVILILSGVYWLNNSKPTQLNAKQCYLTDSHCSVRVADNEIRFRFTSFPIKVEEMTAFALTLPRNLKLQQSWIEGTNMYMGKMPILESAVSSGVSQQDYQLEFFLGACSEPRMRWRMVINLLDVSSNQSHTANLYFQTRYN